MTKKRKIQAGIALTAITSFLIMPVNMACANNITAGSSGIGNQTNIQHNGNVTTITSGVVKGETGLNHFGNFQVDEGGTAELKGANRYINMVDGTVTINGILNAFKNNNSYANTMFVSPKGFVVGKGGVLNVGGLQVLTPSQSTYDALRAKAGSVSGDGSDISLSLSDFADNLKDGTTGYVEIQGKILSNDNVVIQAGNGIYFTEGGLIDTTSSVGDISSMASVSLFTNTGDILNDSGDDFVSIKANGDINFSAKNGGVGSSVSTLPSSGTTKAPKYVTPFNVEIADGYKINIEVSDDSSLFGTTYKGEGSVANVGAANLNVGTLKGGSINVINKGYGTLATTEDITGVKQLHLGAENGMLQVDHAITADNIIRLDGDQGVEVNRNIEVTGSGFVSVASANGGISMQDVTIDTGNVDIKSKASSQNAGEDVVIGNVTIKQRGLYADTMHFRDGLYGEGVSEQEYLRDDGVRITSDNHNIIQREGTKISSAGVVKYIAGKDINSKVSAVDKIAATARKGSVNLVAEGDIRLDDATALNYNVVGDSNILVDGLIQAGNVDITADKDVVVRHHVVLSEHGNKTFGAVQAYSGDVNIKSNNGSILSQVGLEERINDTLINGANDVNLVADNGDIKMNPESFGNPYLSVAAKNKVNAKAKNIAVRLDDTNGKVGVINATNNANIGALNDVTITDKISAGNDLKVAAAGNIKQTVTGASLIAGGDMTLASSGANVGLPTSYLTVDLGGMLDASAKEGVYITSVNDLNASVNAGGDAVVKAPKMVTISSANVGKDFNIEAGEDITATQVQVGGELSAVTPGSIDLGTVGNITLGTIDAGDSATITGTGSILQGSKTPAIKVANDLTINSTGGDVGAANKYMTVDVGGLLDASAKGNVYIASDSDINATVNAGGDAGIKTGGYLTLSSVTTGGNLDIISGEDAVVSNATVGRKLNGRVDGDLDFEAKGNVAIDTLNVDGNAKIAGDSYIYAADHDMPVDGSKLYNIKTGGDLNIVTTGEDIGQSTHYMRVNVGGELSAAAPGSIYISGVDNLDVNKVIAGKNVGLDADYNLHQVAPYNPENPSIIAGGDMTLESTGRTPPYPLFETPEQNVGDPSNPLSIKVGGQLDATSKNGGVYIGSKDNITIGQVDAAKDVSIESDGFIHQTDNGPRPAIIAGEDLHLLSKTNDVGDPNNYLTVKVGDGLDAEAPEGGVYIYGYGDLRTDKVIAGDDIVIGGDKNIIIPHDTDEGNIIGGKNVTIKAGDSVLNGGGDGVGIKAKGDIEIIANLNKKEPAGTIGTLPYNDLRSSINVVLGGDAILDEVGVDPSNKVLNVNILNRTAYVDDGNDGSFDVDDRDQRTLNVNNNGKDGSSDGVGNHRQELRYTVVANDYVVLSSNSDSGAKVQTILNISKNGMLIKTDELPKVGENVKITMDYKGLPFTVEGQVVRTDAAKNTAGIQFKNVDQLTSSMLLYLGMKNGK